MCLEFIHPLDVIWDVIQYSFQFSDELKAFFDSAQQFPAYEHKLDIPSEVLYGTLLSES